MAKDIKRSKEYKDIDYLWIEYKNTKSIKIRNLIATKNDLLAQKVAHKMSRQCRLPIEDIKQIARIGLIRAIEKFDFSRGIKFSSFAYPYIRGEIQHFNRDHGSSIKIPRRTYELASKVRRNTIKQGLPCDQKNMASTACSMGIEADEWRSTVCAVSSVNTVSIDVVAPYIDHTDDILDDTSELLASAIESLPDTYRSYVNDYWFQGMKESAIAKKYDVNISTVRSVLSQSLQHLKAVMT